MVFLPLPKECTKTTSWTSASSVQAKRHDTLTLLDRKFLPTGVKVVDTPTAKIKKKKGNSHQRNKEQVGDLVTYLVSPIAALRSVTSMMSTEEEKKSKLRRLTYKNVVGVMRSIHR